MESAPVLPLLLRLRGMAGGPGSEHVVLLLREAIDSRARLDSEPELLAKEGADGPAPESESEGQTSSVEEQELELELGYKDPSEHADEPARGTCASVFTTTRW